jgi:hypothetical protein
MYELLCFAQQDFKIVHNYYSAGYLYPAVHGTAAQWTAAARASALQAMLDNNVRAAANYYKAIKNRQQSF